MHARCIKNLERDGAGLEEARTRLRLWRHHRRAVNV